MKIRSFLSNWLTPYATSAGRIATLNFLDRSLSFLFYYYLAGLSQINPVLGVLIGFTAEAVVVYVALKVLEKRGLVLSRRASDED